MNALDICFTLKIITPAFTQILTTFNSKRNACALTYSVGKRGKTPPVPYSISIKSVPITRLSEREILHHGKKLDLTSSLC